MIPPKFLTTETPDHPYLFSICTIVNDFTEYALMKKSFEECGFTDACEYIVADNSQKNHFDAYEAIKRFLQESQGKYVIIVHQDVRCIDNQMMLTKCLQELTTMDDHWGVCGNAGCDGYHEDIMYINNAGKIVRSANLPARVNSLDENLLIINKASNITVSSNSGFHLYGTDLCIIARILGYNCYVISFMVNHLSYGNFKGFKKHVKAFIRGYGRKFQGRYIETTCTRFYLGNSTLTSRALNFPPVFFLVKAVQRVKQIYKLLRFGDVHKKSIRYETPHSLEQAGN